MKALFLFLISFLITSVTYAEVIREGDTFKIEQTTKESDTQTKYTWEDKNGNKYPIFITKKGTCYVFKISKKTNKEYKYYLPKKVQETIKKELNIKSNEN